MSSSDLGYIFDFLASLWIIQSIIFRSQRHIEIESQQLWDGNPLQHEAQIKSFWDGWIGIIQFLVGLILHLLHFEVEMRKIYPSSYDVVKKRAKKKALELIEK